MTKKSTNNSGKIGDFWNNKVLEWTPITFAIEFIYRMRKLKDKLLYPPSTRQAIAIPKLLTAMYYRKINLIPEDFINAAVITTPIEDQEIAEKVAFEIIFSTPKERKKKREASSSATNKGKLTGESEDAILDDFIDDLLSEIADMDILSEDVQIDKVMDQVMEEISNIMDFIDTLYEEAEKGNEPYKSLIDLLEHRSGYKELVGKGLNTLEQLKKYLYQLIMKEKNNLTPRDINAIIRIGWGKELMNQTKIPWIKASLMHGLNHPDFQDYISQVLSREDVGTAAKTTRYLKETGMPPQLAKDFSKQLINRISNMMELSDIVNVLDEVPEINEKKVFSNSLKQDMGLSFKISRALDGKHGTNFTSKLFDQWNKSNSKPSLPELYQARNESLKWKQMVNDNINSSMNEFLSGNGEAINKMLKLSRDLNNYALESENESCSEFLKEKACEVGMKALNHTSTPEQFMIGVETLLSNNININEQKILHMSKKLNIPETEIIELLGGTYELLLIMLEKKVSTFHRYFKILNGLKSLTSEQFNELVQKAINTNNIQALGALGHLNLGNAFKVCEKIDPNASQMLSESLSAGPGDNLLLQWFLHRHDIPPKVKSFVRNLVKEALIQIAMNIISNQRGSGEKGLVPSNKLRIFIPGDDLDLIDIDASIENIVMQGKSIDMLSVEDLLVRETEKGRISICFILDISGSMSGMKLAACSIAVMVLIGMLRAEEVAACFFESNTHIVKEFKDDKNLEELADELLDLTARGGTRVQKALEWGGEQLKESTSELKVCFLLTDCEFSESYDEIVKNLETYVAQNVKFLLGVNTRSYSKSMAEWILKTTRGKMVYILNILDIPKVLMEVLEQIT
ncbi:MAG: VWA domain-containing protein [Promethearchaeota archaeon]